MMSMMRAVVPAKWREAWRSVHSRLAALEKRQKESEMLIDLLLSEARYSPGPDVGMHAQHHRRAIVRELFDRINFASAVETGTYMGSTTGFLASEFRVPVFSGELVPRYHHAARRKLVDLENVHLHNSDSRSFLRQLSNDATLTSRPTFFYLDAHWYKDLPLEDEVEIIAGAWKDFVIMVDDFRVPGDPGYAYDDYGPGKVLEMDYLTPACQRHSLSAFFPVLSSAEETGQKVGYVVLSSASCLDRVAACKLLRRD